MITLYKRNSNGKPLFWTIDERLADIKIQYGLVGKEGRIEYITTHREQKDEINSLIKANKLSFLSINSVTSVLVNL